MAQRTLNRRSRSRDADQYDEGQDRGHEPDDDAPPPRRGRGRARSEEPADDEPRGRRSRRDDGDGDEREPRSSRRSSREDDEAPRSRNTSKGWGGFKNKREETSDFVKNYSLPEVQEEIIKILDAEPFSVYAEHWLDDKKGKKSYVCIGDDCPLCAIGDKPRVYTMFNVLDLREGAEPKVYPWKVSQTVTDVLEGYAKSDRTSPIDREDLYFSIRKTGGGQKGKVQTHVTPVKARDLKEDWDIEPFSGAELDEFDLYEEDDVLEFTSRKTLKVIADDLDS